MSPTAGEALRFAEVGHGGKPLDGMMDAQVEAGCQSHSRSLFRRPARLLADADSPADFGRRPRDRVDS